VSGSQTKAREGKGTLVLSILQSIRSKLKATRRKKREREREKRKEDGSDSLCCFRQKRERKREEKKGRERKEKKRHHTLRRGNPKDGRRRDGERGTSFILIKGDESAGVLACNG